MFGRKTKRDFIAEINELKSRCDQLSGDLERNTRIFSDEINKVNDDLQKARSRYVIAERAAQEYHAEADRYQRRYKQLEQHLNDMYESYQRGKYRDNGDWPERKTLEQTEGE